MAAESVPAIGDFKADLDFTRDNLKFTTFRGTVGGGTFDLGGGIGLANLKNPIFDLRLKAREVLGMRNDAITVRADADLALKGPLNSASASGTVWVVQSRFFKEIDILPDRIARSSQTSAQERSDRGEHFLSESSVARLEIRCRDQNPAE